jgi:hypothetical protein
MCEPVAYIAHSSENCNVVNILVCFVSRRYYFTAIVPVCLLTNTLKIDN